jgi:hypothetical protein
LKGENVRLVPSSDREIIYVSGPYTKPEPVLNSKRAIAYGAYLLDAGYVPIIPHLSMFWHMLHPHEWEVWLQYDIQLVRVCHALHRLSGESTGADREVAEAKCHNIPVVYTDWQP